MDTNDIERRFTFHPATDKSRAQHDAIRNALRTTAHWLNSELPDGREKSLALTYLEEVMFWSNAAVLRDGK